MNFKKLVLIIPVVVVLASLLFLTAPEVPHPKRDPGGPLDGFWTHGGHGCFAGTSSYTGIKNGEIFEIIDGEKHPYAQIIRHEHINGNLHLEYRASKSGTIAKSVFLDRGTSLVYVKHITKKRSRAL